MIYGYILQMMWNNRSVPHRNPSEMACRKKTKGIAELVRQFITVKKTPPLPRLSQTEHRSLPPTPQLHIPPRSVGSAKSSQVRWKPESLPRFLSHLTKPRRTSNSRPVPDQPPGACLPSPPPPLPPPLFPIFSSAAGLIPPSLRPALPLLPDRRRGRKGACPLARVRLCSNISETERGSAYRAAAAQGVLRNN